MGILLGVDVGGTFTDFVAYDNSGRSVEVWKVPSVPGDPVSGVLAGLDGFAGKASVEAIRLGTTVATNAVLERKGATVAYVTTRGHQDAVFIQRGNRRWHYDMSWVKPKPLVQRRHCFELNERIDAYGEVLTPLDPAEVVEVARRIRARPEIQAVAVCLLFSYLNPTHELMVKRILAAELGQDMPVSVSYEVLPKWKEYERASTTIADAYLRPVVTRQLSRMRARLDEAGHRAGAVVIKSNGGEMTLDAAASAPVNLVLSGPTGGVIASRHIAELLSIDRLVTIDMGGTSTDVSTVLDRKESFTTAFEIEWGVPIQIPMIDIRTIGAGGGSIAWIDKGGLLRVGPQSAGARPGPACYGNGGTEATVTDANLVLGRINPANFLGGRMKLDVEAARAAIGRVAQALGPNIGVEETAMAIVRIVNNNMIAALRSVLIERGLDPHDFTLCAFGGATPLHASELCGEVGIPKAIVPLNPGQFSAYGFILTNPRVDRQRTTQLTSKGFDGKRANEVMEALVAESVGELEAQGLKEGFEVYRGLEMRYLGQNYELELPLTFERFDETTSERLWTAFHEAHEARFGFSIPGEIIEIVNYTVTVTARTPKPAIARIEAGGGNPEPTERRTVWLLGGPQEVPIFDRERLRAGDRITGPALIEEAASVTMLDAGHRLTVDAFGHLLIDTTV